MINGWKSYYKKPTIESGFDYYKIVFPLKPAKTTDKTTNKTTDKTVIIINMLKKDPFLTAKEVSKEIAVTEEGARYYLNRLKEEGTIKRVGSRKKGKWEILSCRRNAIK